MDRCQNLLQFGHALAVRVCCVKFLQFVAQMLSAARGDVIGRARGQSGRRSLPSAALRRIDIFFDERPAHSKKYRTHRIGCPFGKERSALGVTSALARTLLSHSARSAIIGSTRLALRAGIQQARSAMPNKSKAPHVKVIGSEVLTP